LLLEPNDFPAARIFQKSVFEAGIPLTSFAVADVQLEYERMKNLGVEFSMKPSAAGPTTVAVFNYACGNLLQISQE
jgi:hypothetical protein